MSKRIVLFASVLIAMAGLNPTSASAHPIDNWGANSHFIFNQNGGEPFFEFEGGQTISSVPANYYFVEDTDQDGDMVSLNTSLTSMTALQIPNYMLNMANVSAKLTLTSVYGVTDLSSGVDIDWQMTATMSFVSSGNSINPGNCTTDEFEIDITGDWGDTVSADFEIPALSGTGTQRCGPTGTPHASELNSDLGLGVLGATLSLYKFGATTSAGADLVGS